MESLIEGGGDDVVLRQPGDFPKLNNIKVFSPTTTTAGL